MWISNSSRWYHSWNKEVRGIMDTHLKLRLTLCTTSSLKIKRIPRREKYITPYSLMLYVSHLKIQPPQNTILHWDKGVFSRDLKEGAAKVCCSIKGEQSIEALKHPWKAHPKWTNMILWKEEIHWNMLRVIPRIINRTKWDESCGTMSGNYIKGAKKGLPL